MVTCCHSGQRSAPSHLWQARTREDLTFQKGAAQGVTPGFQRTPPAGRRWRRGDGVTARRERGRKKEKRDRKVNIERKGLHTFGLPKVGEQVTARASRSPRGLVTQRGLQGGPQEEELPPLPPGIRSHPLHQHRKKMEGKKLKGICQKNEPDSPRAPAAVPSPESRRDRQRCPDLCVATGPGKRGRAQQNTDHPSAIPWENKNQPRDLPPSLILTSRTTPAAFK